MKNPLLSIGLAASCAALLSAARAGSTAEAGGDGGGKETANKRALAAAGLADNAKRGASGKEQFAEGFGPPPGGWPADAKTGFIKEIKVEGLAEPEAHYHIMVPKEYSPQQAWPLVVVLHGGPGGRAIDLAAVLSLGFAGKGAISVYPQALRKVLLEWNYPHEGAYILRIVRQVAKAYRIDPCRVYLIGHSMGGGGTWAQGAILKDAWAAIGPFSGWYAAMPAPKPDLLKDTPCYVIHGSADPAVPVSRSQQGVADLKKAGNKEVEYRELAGVGHDIFTNQKPELAKMADWILSKKRSAPADLAAAERSLAAWGKAFGWSPDGGPIGKFKDEKSGPAKKK